MKNILIAGVNSVPESNISNPVFKGTRLETWTWPGGTNDFFKLIVQKGVTIILTIGVLVFFFMLLTGAIQWISSGGDKQSLETAKNKVTNAIIGLVVLFAVFAIVRVMETFFGISILTLDISSLKI